LPAPVILVINPGSTSTRTALYDGMSVLAQKEIPCQVFFGKQDLAACVTMSDQIGVRTQQVRAFLAGVGRTVSQCDAVAARGGPLRALPGGVYQINEAMLQDARSDKFVQHVSRLACIIAHDLCEGTGTPDATNRVGGDVPCFVVDPVSTDEMADLARISGLKELPRQALTHALNMKRVARQFARTIGKTYESLNLITAHLGGGASIAVHQGGRMIDSVDANGDGPFSPERAGGLRADSLAGYVLESGKDFRTIQALLTRESGLKSHLGTTDAKAIEERVLAGDAKAKLVYEAMAYSVAKHICGLSAAVCGKLDGVILTGGLARSEMLVEWIRQRVQFLGPFSVYPGENEMAALAEGVARALSGEETVKVYPTGEAVPKSRS
jgi:butyrate kinase